MIRLRKVAIMVNDLEKQVRFWRDIVGLEQLSAGSDRAVLKASSDTVMALYKAGEGARGGVKLMFLVDNIEEAYRELSGKGVGFEAPPKAEEPGFKWTVFKDPEGNEYVLMELSDDGG